MNLLVKWIVNLIPFIAWVTKAAAAVTQWMGANKAVAISLLLVGAAVAIATGGLSLIIPAILAVIAAFTYLWKHSQTFRDVVTQVASNVAHAFIQMGLFILAALKTITGSVLAFAGITIRAMATAFGWVPGLGPKLKAAAKSFDSFRASVDGVFTHLHNTLEGWKQTVDNMPHIVKIQGDITDLTAKVTAANIAQLVAAIRTARAQLASLNGATATTYVYTVTSPQQGPHAATGGVIGARASGGGWGGGLTMVGEHGRELVKLPTGSYVHSNPDTERMMGQGGGAASVTVELRAAGADSFLRWLREAIRIRGGDVQAVLGH
jgi:hypothetical protein